MIQPRNYWETFEKTYQMGPQKHRIYLLDLLRQKGVESILDVGCGTGPIYQLISEDLIPTNSESRWNFDYKGVDYSRSMIEVCNKEFPKGNFEVQDARDLDEDDNSWDCVLLLHCLDHLDDYKSAIAEAARVAKRYVCIVLWRPFVKGDNRLNDRNMYGKEEGEEPWDDTYLHEYNKEKLEKEFEKNNLKVVHIAEGEILNEPGHYNFLWLLRKET